MSRGQLNRSLKQLAVVLRLEEDKEKAALHAFKTAQDYLQQQQNKLSSLQQYRLDYMRQIQQEGSSGVMARHYQQRLSFVGKLDKACEQQSNVVRQSMLAMEQRRAQWLAQQQRRKAVDKLIEKSRSSLATLDARTEQQEMDEYAMQGLRRRSA